MKQQKALHSCIKLYFALDVTRQKQYSNEASWHLTIHDNAELKQFKQLLTNWLKSNTRKTGSNLSFSEVHCLQAFTKQ